MKKVNPLIKYLIIKLAIFFVLAIFAFIFRKPLVENLNYFIGGLMLLYGVEEIVFEIIFSRPHILHGDKIYLGFVELVLGIVTLIAPMSYEAVCIIWATWSIMREAHEIEEIFTEIKNLLPKIISGIESIVVIVFSILLIVNPTEHHAMIHLYLLLAELIITPATPLIDELLSKEEQPQEQE